MVTYPERKRFKLFVVAGDPSGDVHAAGVIQALNQLAKEQGYSAEIHGVGGPRMASAGAELIADQSRMARVGLGALSAIPYHWQLGKRILKHLATFRPDVVLLVDYGGFNLRLAQALRQAGHTVHYFIPPQLWASRAGRIRSIQNAVDHVYCIFPFEEALYQQAGVPVTYVGHPLSGTLPPPVTRAQFCLTNGLDPERPIVALLPGSRTMEITHLLPPMAAACARVAMTRTQQDLPTCQFVLAQADAMATGEKRIWFERQLQRASFLLQGQRLQRVQGQTQALMSVADAGWVASGTATLEAALYGMPTVLAYKGGWLIYQIAKRVVRLPCIGLPNILLNMGKPPSQWRPVIPELWQADVNGPRLACELSPLLIKDSPALRQMQQDFQQIQEQLLLTGDNTTQKTCAQRVAKALLC